MGLVVEVFESCLEHYTQPKEEAKTSNTTKLVKFTALAIVILIIAIFGQLLWNIFLAGAGKGIGYFTFIKPLPSPLHTIGVYLTLVLFFGSC